MSSSERWTVTVITAAKKDRKNTAKTETLTLMKCITSTNNYIRCIPNMCYLNLIFQLSTNIIELCEIC